MLADHKSSRLERELAKAGSQWQEEDLQEIMALLEKDYTKPQEPPRDELEELKELLDKDYTKEEPPKPAHFPPLFGGGPLFREPEEEPKPTQEPVEEPGEQPVEEPGERPVEEPAEEIAEAVAPGEQADFSEEPPEQPKKGWTSLLPLSIVAAVELAAIVAILIWWRQWIV